MILYNYKPIVIKVYAECLYQEFNPDVSTSIICRQGVRLKALRHVSDTAVLLTHITKR